MTVCREPEFLSFGDSLFLYLEREGTPLNIASLALFEGQLDVSDLRMHVASKLREIPRYMQRVIVPAFNVGMPRWEFTSTFDITYHVREVTLSSGTKAELKRVAASLLSVNMDREKPLWDLTLIRGLNDGRTALLGRVHHCMADGLSGVGLLNALMDTTPAVPMLRECKIRVPRAKPTTNGDDVLGSAMKSWFSTLDRLLEAGNQLLTLFQRTAGLHAGGSEEVEDNRSLKGHEPDGLMRLAMHLAELPQRLPFNTVCKGPQHYEWTEASLADLKAIRVASKATLNDVILSVIVSAFSRYLALGGTSVKGRSIRVVVPMSTRRHHRDSDGLGNQITFAPVNAPLGISSPRRLLAMVHERMQFVKTAHVAEFVSFAGTLLGTVPTSLQAAIAPAVSAMPISLCNTIFTHVPGPKTPIYLLGHKLISAYPYVPIGGEMGINCAVLTYNGGVYFGFTGDASAAPHFARLAHSVDESISRFKRAFKVRNPRTRPSLSDDSARPSAIGVMEAAPEKAMAMAATQTDSTAA